MGLFVNNFTTHVFDKFIAFAYKGDDPPQPEAHNYELDGNTDPRSDYISVVMSILVDHEEGSFHQPEDDSNNDERINPFNIGILHSLIQDPRQDQVNLTDNYRDNHISNVFAILVLNVHKECK